MGIPTFFSNLRKSLRTSAFLAKATEKFDVAFRHIKVTNVLTDSLY